MEFNRRNHQRTAIERIERFTRGDEFPAIDLVGLQDRRQLLETAFRNFETEHMALIEENVRPADLEVQEDFAAQTEEVYLAALGRLRNRIHEITVNIANESAENNERNNDGHGRRAEQPPNANLRLERIAIIPFTGDYAHWSEWRAMFDSLVHEIPTLSDTQKFHYLKQSVGGQAAQVLRGWQILGQNYQAAYDSLVNIYENQYRIIIAHLEELNSMPKLELETHEGLRILVDTTNRVLRQLASPAIGAPTEHWDHFVVYLLLVRCPPRTISAWETAHRQMRMPTLAEFTTFLNQRAMSLLTFGPSTSKTNVPGQKQTKESSNGNSNAKPKSDNKPTNQTETQQRALQCHNCKLPHPLYRCLAFLQMSVSDRKKRVRELALCDNCFMTGHRAGTPQCQFGACRRCNRNQFHNTLLCDIPTATVATAQGEAEASQSIQQNFQ